MARNISRLTKNIIAIVLLFPILAFSQQQRGVTLQNTETPPTTGKTYAIVIGISNYKEANPLRFADKDAETFAEFLLRKTGIGVGSNNLFLFVNEQANKNNIGSAIYDILVRRKVGKGDRVIFFFAGHGDYDANVMKDQALLLLWGAPKENYFQNVFGGDYLSTTELNSNFIDQVSARGGEVMLIVDACHATGVNKKLSGGAEGGRVTALALQSMTSPIKIYSCKENEYSLEGEQWGGGHGLFSYVMMQGLYGLADANKDGTVSFRELQRYLEDNVSDMAAPNKQDPVVKIDDNNKPVVKVDNAYLTAYLNKSSPSSGFMSRAGTKGNLAVEEKGMDSALMKMYHTCDSLINSHQLDSAYNLFLVFATKDSISNISIQLRRDLCSALEEKPAGIINVLFEDPEKLPSIKGEINIARNELAKAEGLLGERHYLHNSMEAMVLFLDALNIYVKLQRFNLDKSEADKAVYYLKKSIELQPNAPYSYFFLGYILFWERNIPEGAACFQKYVSLVPKSSIAHYQLGGAYGYMGKTKEMVAAYYKAIELDSTRWYYYYSLVGYYNGFGNFDMAIKMMRKVLELKHSDDPLEIQKMGDLFNKSGNNKEADKYYTDAIHHFEDSFKVKSSKYVSYVDDNYFELKYGECLYRLNKYKEATQSFEKLLSKDSTYSQAYYYLCIINTSLKQEKQSAYYLQKMFDAVNKHGKNAGSELMDLGYKFVDAKYYDLGIECYKKALETLTDNKEDNLDDITAQNNCNYNIACAYSIQNKPKESLYFLEKALQKKYDVGYLESDPDMDNIRTLPAFRKLLEKYATKEDLAKMPKMFVVQKK